ncbi:MAG: ATP-dependent 6-phosphofructokinase [Proteobacteria bacterium]|nr:ATP-dependent 6-phosphofructokinase [Pseudomonadota bacterium]
MTKRIGILTSGGDCAGLNATIRAVALRAQLGYGWTTVGLRYGTLGLLERPVDAVTLDPARLDAALARQGGTFLGSTNRGDPFAFPMPDGSKKDRSGEMVEGLKLLGLEGLIGVGGDGSLAILRRLLAPSGIPFVGVPKTIDNDVDHTERAVGYSTAVAIATEALDRLQPTGASHERTMVLEVMGRDAGHIAIAAAIAGGADVVLIPEVRWHLERVVSRIARLRAAGRTSALVVVAEAAGQSDEAADPATDAPDRGVGDWLAKRLVKATGAEARATVLGHVQRGAMPTAEDRLLAAALGVRAVDLLAEGKADHMVAWWNRQVIDVPLEKVVGRSQTVDPDGTLIRTARALGICLGDTA